MGAGVVAEELGIRVCPMLPEVKDAVGKGDDWA
jgi:hypothetical protein